MFVARAVSELGGHYRVFNLEGGRYNGQSLLVALKSFFFFIAQ